MVSQFSTFTGVTSGPSPWTNTCRVCKQQQLSAPQNTNTRSASDVGVWTSAEAEAPPGRFQLAVLLIGMLLLVSMMLGWHKVAVHKQVIKNGCFAGGNRTSAATSIIWRAEVFLFSTVCHAASLNVEVSVRPFLLKIAARRSARSRTVSVMRHYVNIGRKCRLEPGEDGEHSQRELQALLSNHKNQDHHEFHYDLVQQCADSQCFNP